MKINIYNTTFHFCKISNLVLNEIIFSNNNFLIGCFFSLKFAETAFAVSIISSHVMTESSIILPIYLNFLEQRVAEF